MVRALICCLLLAACSLFAASPVYMVLWFDTEDYVEPGVYSEEQRAGWKRVTDAAHGAGGLIFVQLWDQGSVSHRSVYADGRLPLGPSTVNPEQLIHVKERQDHERDPRAKWHFKRSSRP